MQVQLRKTLFCVSFTLGSRLPFKIRVSPKPCTRTETPQSRVHSFCTQGEVGDVQSLSRELAGEVCWKTRNPQELTHLISHFQVWGGGLVFPFFFFF